MDKDRQIPVNKIIGTEPMMRLNVNPASARVNISINPDYITRITNRLKPYKHTPNWVRPAMTAVADYIRSQAIPRVFREEGPGWAPLAPKTRADRKRLGYGPGHPILRRTGDLYRELTDKNHPNHVEILKTGKDATIIFGGSSAKFYANQLGAPSKHLPSRPMVPGSPQFAFTDRDRQEITKIFKGELSKALRKRQGNT